MSKPFPFSKGSFDGVFSTGILHLFPKRTLRGIAKEINRVLKPGGKLFISMPVAIKRVASDGKCLTFGSEPLYSVAGGKQILRSLFPGYRIRIHSFRGASEWYPNTNPPYTFSSSCVLLFGKKVG